MCIISSLAVIGTALGASAAWAAPVGGVVAGTAALAVAGATVGGVMGAVTSIQQANVAQDNADRQGDLASYQEQMNRDKVRQVADAGAFEMRQQNLRQAALMDDHQVSGAANGVMLGTGSMLDWELSSNEVFEENNRQLDYDIENRKHSARIGVWNAGNSKASAYASADAYGDQIPMLAVGGIVNTFSNTVSSGLNILSGAMKFKTA